MFARLAVAVVAVVVMTNLSFAEEPLRGEAAARALTGRWKLVHAERSGKAVPPETLAARPMEFHFADGKLIVKADKIEREGKFAIDVSKQPMEITLTPNGQPPLEGIFKFEGDKLVICGRAGNAPGDRPQTFDSTADSKYAVTIYERIK